MDSLKDLLTASKENISLTILKKDFSQQKINKINLNDSIFNKINFNKCDFYGCTFEKCDFIKCDFAFASFLNVRFKECVFHGCTFDNANMSDTVFDQCTKLKCSFTNITLSDTVSGIDDSDIKIITEEENRDKVAELAKAYQNFRSITPDEYIIDGKSGTIFVVVYDPENQQYRFMAMLNDESVISDTMDIVETTTQNEFNEMCRDILRAAELRIKSENLEASIAFRKIMDENFSNNSLISEAKEPWDPYHFEIGDKVYTIVNLKFEDFKEMIENFKKDGYKVTNPRKNAYRIRKAKETNAWNLWNEIKKNYPDLYDKYTFGVYANGLVTVEWPKSIEGKYLRVSQKEN